MFASRGVRTTFEGVVAYAFATPSYLGGVTFYVAPSGADAQEAAAQLQRSEAASGVPTTAIGRIVGLSTAVGAWEIDTTGAPIAITAIGPLFVVVTPGPILGNTAAARHAGSLATQTLLRYGIAQAHRSGIS